MINVSKEFLEEMNVRTDFKQSASVKLSDGTEIPVDYSDFSLKNNGIVDGAGESSIPLGVAIERSIQLEIFNDDGKYSNYDFFDAEITLSLEFELSNSIEKINFGKFTVVEPYTRGTTIIVTAVDDMYKADIPYDTPLVFPATIGEMLRDSCSATGISLFSSEFAHNDFVVEERPNGYTHRQIIGFIAMIAGGNARINRSNQLEIISYNIWKNNAVLDGGDFTAWIHENTVDGGSFNPWSTGIYVSGGEFSDLQKYHVLSEWMNDPKIDTDDIVITGIQTVYTEEDKEKTILVGEEGYVLKIENPLIYGKEQEVLQYISENLIGSTFRQFEGDHISYPLAEFMDAAIVVDRSGNIYNSFITDVDFAFLGMTTFKNSAEPVLRNRMSRPPSNAEVIRQTKKLVAYEKTEREKAIAQLQEALENSSGMYVTTKTQLDKSTIYYAHNKPTLEESNIVWKYTAEAIAASTDGGKTYPYGFTVTGDMITKILNTEGINASWINTGAFVVKDNNGNIIFSADVDTKRVTFVNGYFDATGAHFIDGFFSGKVTGSEISGSKISTQNTNGSEVILLEKGRMTFYSEPDASLDDEDISGYIQPGTTYAPVGNEEYEFPCIKFQSTEWAVLELWAGNDKVMQAIPTDDFSDVAARIFFPQYVDVQKSLEVYQDMIVGMGLYVDGDFYCYGSKDRVVKTENYGDRGMNAFETAEPYFSDIGSGIIDDSGKAVIEFESIFSETIETDIPYQVFITPTSELNCRCVEKECCRFTMSGDPGATFDYMICAKQKGYANTRLENIERKR